MPDASALDVHRELRDRHRQAAKASDRQATRLAFINLLVALAAIVFFASWVSSQSGSWGGASVLAALVFAAVRALQTRALATRDWAQARSDVHARHCARVTGDWREFPSGPRCDPQHPFALDLDLDGASSLVQRIDVTHTRRGESTLLSWLSNSAPVPTVMKRQAAVVELAGNIGFRESLEAAGAIARPESKLDERPFLAFVAQRGVFVDRPWLIAVAWAAPILTLTLLVLSVFGVISGIAPAVMVGLQALVTLWTGALVQQRFTLVAARRGFAESFVHILRAIEDADFKAEQLLALRGALSSGEVKPSRQFQGLDRYAGLSDLRFQVLAHLPINWLVLWDLNVLYQLERWVARHQQDFEAIFDAVGSLEALTSLATLLDVDRAATMPEVSEPGDGSLAALSAEGIVHPLLTEGNRVGNDITLPGKGSCLVVTGSNMAGKSTLLRSVGLNLALALAGGPVCAQQWRCRPLRIRASMRAEDDLGQGASYFHAELNKLRTVIADADAEPPIFFLLDELLRGTNARARHVGARAVIEHLLDRGALGLVATHDTQLGAMADARPGLVGNAHFTDVVIDGEMTFDYKLHDGVVRTSNALRLLQMAGIDVRTELMEVSEASAPALPDSSRVG